VLTYEARSWSVVSVDELGAEVQQVAGDRGVGLVDRPADAEGGDRDAQRRQVAEPGDALLHQGLHRGGQGAERRGVGLLRRLEVGDLGLGGGLGAVERGQIRGLLSVGEVDLDLVALVLDGVDQSGQREGDVRLSVQVVHRADRRVLAHHPRGGQGHTCDQRHQHEQDEPSAQA
jgi:hypothetical protein